MSFSVPSPLPPVKGGLMVTSVRAAGHPHCFASLRTERKARFKASGVVDIAFGTRFDKAFTPLVYNAGDSTPRRVVYLTGSASVSL